MSGDTGGVALRIVIRSTRVGQSGLDLRLFRRATFRMIDGRLDGSSAPKLRSDAPAHGL